MIVAVAKVVVMAAAVAATVVAVAAMAVTVVAAIAATTGLQRGDREPSFSPATL